MAQDIFLGKRYAGFVEKGVFITSRRKSEHLFNLWKGIGFNHALIDRFVETGLVQSIKVLYNTGSEEKVLITTPLHIALVATEWSNAKDIKDNQYILPLKEFEENHTPDTSTIPGGKE